MSDTPIEQSAEHTSDQDDAVPATSLTTEDVEEQIREAEALHQELTQRLKATAHE